MPQLNFPDFAPQLVWLLITFTLLYILLSRVALPRVERVIVERKSRIGGDLERAREARVAADKESARYDAEVAAARARGQAHVRSAREKLDADLAAKRSAADAETTARVSAAQQAIQERAEETSRQMDTIASDVVGDIVKELAGVDVSEAEVCGAMRRGEKA